MALADLDATTKIQLANQAAQRAPQSVANPLATSLSQAPPVARPSIVSTIAPPPTPVAASQWTPEQIAAFNQRKSARLAQHNALLAQKIAAEQTRLRAASPNRGPQALTTPGTPLARPVLPAASSPIAAQSIQRAAVAPTALAVAPTAAPVNAQAAPVTQSGNANPQLARPAEKTELVRPVKPVESDANKFAQGLRTQLNIK